MNILDLKGLTRATRLVKLHLRSQCSDAVLATVAASCSLLRQIDISRSEQVRTDQNRWKPFFKGWLQLVTAQVTDSGLKHLHSCSSLVSVNVLKCWALTPAGVGGSTNLIFQRHCRSLTVHLLQYVCRTPACSSTYSLALLCEHDGSDGGNLKRREGACRSFFSRAL